MFIMNTEALEYNTKTLKNVGCDTQKIWLTKRTNLPKLEKNKKRMNKLKKTIKLPVRNNN